MSMTEAEERERRMLVRGYLYQIVKDEYPEVDWEFLQGDRSVEWEEANLALLAAVRELQHGLAQIESRHVLLLRAQHVTWGRIGKALGVSAQAAQQRFC